jgi:DNA-directed RNA polymerase subunit RPC12/RpoP
MNARIEHVVKEHKTVAQGANNNTAGGGHAAESDREYTCLGCDQQLESFTVECPDCGGRQFQTDVPGVSNSVHTPGYDFIETTLARFNPYIPR